MRFNHHRMNRYLANCCLAILSLLLSLLLAEGLSRLLLDPVDYLLPSLVNDSILGHSIAPNSAGHDSWGYRNKQVPSRAEIVTIGDSQTYGVSATARNSWPALLQHLEGTVVYNLSLGAYGPLEYLYLLQHRALALTPSLIIVGFYYGNDIRDAYVTVYRNDYWSAHRKPEFTGRTQLGSDNCPKFREHQITTRYRFFRALRSLREWFSHHSVLYRIVVNSRIGDFMRLVETTYDYAGNEITLFEDKHGHIRTGFTPRCRLEALDLNDPKIIEGLRISLEAFKQMNEITRRSGARFLVLLIPTKESVFAPHIKGNRQLRHSRIIDHLIRKEAQLNERVQAYFDGHGIAYLDVAPALRDAVGRVDIYPSNYDSHPNKNGYRVIANAISDHLRKNAPKEERQTM